jgi:nucleotide-binding universal stress UspA family protein
MAHRSSYDNGHTPKYLVVIDETVECDRALYYAARCCARNRAALLLAMVNAPTEYGNWLGVGEVMRAEAEQAAQAILDHAAARAREIGGIDAECLIREGHRADEVLTLVDEDRDIAVLVLAAGTGADGPGPLVSTLVAKAGSLPIPIAIIPGSLADEEIDALA